MNEIALSDNLAQIELEINHHKQIAGQSIWEIGRRLNHVKEHDLAHGQFVEWVEKQGINRSEAYKMMRVANEIPNVGTYQHLGTKALYLIATLPDDEKQTQLDRIENGETKLVAFDPATYTIPAGHPVYRTLVMINEKRLEEQTA